MKATGYLKVLLFGLIIFIGLWLVTDISALDLVKKPALVFGLSILFILILLNWKMVNNLREIKYEKLSEEEKKVADIQESAWYQNLMQKLTSTKLFKCNCMSGSMSLNLSIYLESSIKLLGADGGSMPVMSLKFGSLTSIINL